MGKPDAAEGQSAQATRRLLRGFLLRHLPVLGIGLQILLLVVVFFWDRIFIVIQAGEAGVLWSRFAGTQIDRVRGEGLNIISPLDRMTIYEVRKQVVEHSLAVLSVEGMHLQLDLAIRYRPERDLLGMLQERIGPDYLTRVVVPQTESVLRKQLGNATAEQIYTNDNGLLTRAMLQAMDEIGRNFVEVEDIIIRRIRLPETVRRAIEDKLVQQQVLESYVFRRDIAVQEAERRRIEASGIRDYQAIVDETLTDRLLAHQGIRATQEIAASQNPKTVVIGASQDLSVPIFLDRDATSPAPEPAGITPPDRASGGGHR
jgi:regulator of protease activity HflC (stomatin/prohibitin superfamily)